MKKQRLNMAKKILLTLFAVLFVFVSSSWAEVVRPSSRVENGVTIRSLPTTESAPLGLLEPGEELSYVGSVPWWNIVRLDNGQEAYVSKAWTIVVPEAATGNFTIHAVDVGTGLAIVVQGSDFILVYDGGSKDDKSLENDNRLLAYLSELNPPPTQIDHLILSHPHQDHVELLPDLFDSYEIDHVWDSGCDHTICAYRAFLRKVASEPGVTYHTALANFGNRQVSFGQKYCYGNNLQPETIDIELGASIDDDPVQLGSGATMTFLYADPSAHSSLNENSLVVRLDLGQTRLLLTGDAEAGGRADPSTAPSNHSIEGNLIECCSEDLSADILVVAHHGSKTSSRTAFLDAVSADTFIVSSGPTQYGSVVLPDSEVITELENRGTVYRTDRDDNACGTNTAKIGPDNDGKVGGCDNIQIDIASDGTYTAAYWP